MFSASCLTSERFLKCTESSGISAAHRNMPKSHILRQPDRHGVIHAYPVSAESLDPAGRSGEYAAGIKRVAQSEQGVATNLATLLAFETL